MANIPPGKQPCFTCNRTGYRTERKIEICNHDRRFPCYKCYGSGRIEKDEKIICYMCSGKGYY